MANAKPRAKPQENREVCGGGVESMSPQLGLL